MDQRWFWNHEVQSVPVIPPYIVQAWISGQVTSVSYYNGGASKDFFFNNFNNLLVSRMGNPQNTETNPNSTFDMYCLDAIAWQDQLCIDCQFGVKYLDTDLKC